MKPSNFQGKTLKDVITHFELHWLEADEPGKFDTMLGKRHLSLYAVHEIDGGDGDDDLVYEHPIDVTVARVDNEKRTITLRTMCSCPIPGMKTGKEMTLFVTDDADEYLSLGCSHQLGWSYDTSDTFDSAESWILWEDAPFH